MGLNRLYRPALALALLLVLAPLAQAGKKLEIDQTKWISIGAGLRGSFSAIENAAPSGNDWSKDFNLDSARLYLNGQITKNIKFELNLACVFCGNSALQDYIVLDGIAKFEFNPYFNLWAGRLLVPADRAEMSGPFYANTYDFNRTPFYPADYSTHYGNGGAGVYGRDNGADIWGALTEDKRLTYAVGVFNGYRGGPNQKDNLLYAGRFSYNFWNIESNPGYYTSSTYYGKAGDIFTLAVAIEHQKDGAGTQAQPGDFTGGSVDMLMEKVLGGGSVLTVEGEYKNFNTDLSNAALADPSCFCLFDGDAYTGTVLYMFPQQVGVGHLQPYVRFTKNDPSNSDIRKEYEAGINYIIDGQNARVSLMYEYGDIATKGLNYTPSATGDKVSAVKVGVQLQI